MTINNGKSLNKLRSKTALKIQEAASHGDLKENYDYKAAKEEMELLEYKRQLLQSLAPFEFIKYSDINDEEKPEWIKIEENNFIKVR